MRTTRKTPPGPVTMVQLGAPQPGATDQFIRVGFRVLAILEACTWAGLLISMLIKCPLGGTPMGVTVFGWLHVLAWILFVLVCIIAGVWFRWRWWITLTGTIFSVLPFLTIPFDIWMERSGRLHKRSRRYRATHQRPGEKE